MTFNVYFIKKKNLSKLVVVMNVAFSPQSSGILAGSWSTEGSFGNMRYISPKITLYHYILTVILSLFVIIT